MNHAFSIKVIAVSTAAAVCLAVAHAAGAEGGNGGPPATAPDRAQSIEQYQRQIAEVENLSGALDPSLEEPLTALGLLYKDAGEYEQATETLYQALHISRIHYGINSDEQIPILNALVSVDIRAQKWNDLNEVYHRIFWVANRNYEPGSDSMLAISRVVGRWKILAVRNDLLKEPKLTTINAAADMYDSMIGKLEARYGDDDERLIEPLYGRALTSYQQFIEVSKIPLANFAAGGNDTQTIQQCTTVPGPNGKPRQVCRTITVPDTAAMLRRQQDKNTQLRRHLQSVEASLSRIVEISEKTSPTSDARTAEALVHLGDFHLYSEEENAAVRYYTRAYNLLIDNPAVSDDMDRLFVKPARVPALIRNFPGPPRAQSSDAPGPKVVLTFEITAHGKTRKVEVLKDKTTANRKIQRLAVKMARESRFRPRFADGELLEAQAVELHLP